MRALRCLAVALLIAACGSASAAGGRPRVSFENVGGPPFGVAATRDSRYAFVDLVSGQLLVDSVHGRSAPRVVRSIPLAGQPLGSSLTHDGRLLLIANGQGATVVSVARAERGSPHPVLGTLTPPRAAHLRAGGAIETTSSPDGRYVFVSLEYGPGGGAIAVYRIGDTAAPHLGPGAYVGSIGLGLAVVGSAVSPDGRYLYVTSELARESVARALFGAGRTLARRIRSETQSAAPAGTLSVIGVARAEHDPAHAVLATAPAMGQPVRVALSRDGSTVWVTARARDRLLAFSAGRLRRDPRHALLASIRVGTAPVGVAVSADGRRVIVADSDRFDAPGRRPAITIVDAHAALARRPAIAATLPAGQFPREIAVEPDGAALISDFGSDQLETISEIR